ncbi:MAG: hypothetical protein N2317_01835 [Syntrophales bacterium]|nr:hypothetical protein [Syntrophales bacterium]
MLWESFTKVLFVKLTLLGNGFIYGITQRDLYTRGWLGRTLNVGVALGYGMMMLSFLGVKG